MRITSKLIRWVEHQSERKIAEDVTWEGTTTDKYFHYKGAERRLIVEHTIDWPEYGVWQADKEVEVINDESPATRKGQPRRGVVVND